MSNTNTATKKCWTCPGCKAQNVGARCLCTTHINPSTVAALDAIRLETPTRRNRR